MCIVNSQWNSLSYKLCWQKNTGHVSFIWEINPAESIFLYRYLPPEKCDVSDDLSAPAVIRYKWLRVQCETVGKSICIHLSLLSAVESANYFSAGLKALSFCWVARGAQEVQPGTTTE